MDWRLPIMKLFLRLWPDQELTNDIMQRLDSFISNGYDKDKCFLVNGNNEQLQEIMQEFNLPSIGTKTVFFKEGAVFYSPVPSRDLEEYEKVYIYPARGTQFSSIR